MAMSNSSGNTSVTGSVNAIATGKRPTAHLLGDAVVNTTTTLGTVGAGKKWTILSIVHNATIATAVTGKATLQAGDIILSRLFLQATATQPSHLAIALAYPSSDAPQLTEGQTVILTSNSAVLSTSASVTYIEEDA